MSLGRIFVAVFITLLLLKATELAGQAIGWGLECAARDFCR